MATIVMRKMLLKFIALGIFVIFSCIVHAQYHNFVLQDKYKGFEAKDGKGYVEIEILDSANIDSYIGYVYSTLAESYPDAKIQTIGTRVVRMDATSEGIFMSAVKAGVLEMFVDFSIMVEVREHPDELKYWTDSLGVRHPWNDRHQIRFYVPVVKKIIAYNPYYRPDVKEYITSKIDMHEALMGKGATGYTFSEDFTREIDMYIINNIRAELNKNYYKTYDNGRYESLARKNKR